MQRPRALSSVSGFSGGTGNLCPLPFFHGGWRIHGDGVILDLCSGSTATSFFSVASGGIYNDGVSDGELLRRHHHPLLL
jgi:hypothetical protein